MKYTIIQRGKSQPYPWMLPTRIDGKLHFEDDFLYGYDDAVLRVSRRKKTVEVRLGIDQLTFWIGYCETAKA